MREVESSIYRACLRLLLLAFVCLFSMEPAQADETPDDEPVVAAPPLAKLRAKAADDELSAADRANIRTMEIFTSGWFFVLGSVVGSFLNVVIYRLPAGITLVRPPSRCPACLTKICLKDNLPIIGWLRLRGRCRACGVSISKRYPCVEAAVGLLFLSLLHVELLSGGANLPVREPNMYRGVVWIIWYTKWDLVGIYAAHALLLTTLLAAALIVADGHQVPRKLLMPIGLFALIGSLLWPTLHPVKCLNPMPAAISSLRIETVWQDSIFSGWPVRTGIGLEGLVTSLAGAIAGVLVGWCLGRCIVSRAVVEDHSQEGLQSALQVGWQRSLIAVVGITGLVLGWQAVLTIGIPALVAQGVMRLSRRPSWQRWLNPVATWSLSTLLVLLCWRLVAGVVS